MKLLQTDSDVVGITAWMAVKNRSAQRIMGALVCLVLSASGASAATLNVVGGQLLGASGVIVDGDSYNVEFLDGTCISLYSGCDSTSDFTFQSQAAANLASQALLDQVFLDGVDLFDSDPELTAGCQSTLLCAAHTPYGVAAGFVSSSAAENFQPSGGTEAVVPRDFAVSNDLTGSSFYTYAVWAVVPEPSTAILMGLGLLGLALGGTSPLRPGRGRDAARPIRAVQ